MTQTAPGNTTRYYPTFLIPSLPNISQVVNHDFNEKIVYISLYFYFYSYFVEFKVLCLPYIGGVSGKQETESGK